MTINQPQMFLNYFDQLVVAMNGTLYTGTTRHPIGDVNRCSYACGTGGTMGSFDPTDRLTSTALTSSSTVTATGVDVTASSSGYDISADGTTITGWYYDTVDTLPQTRGFRWVIGSNPVALPISSSSDIGMLLSDDGMVIIGSSTSLQRTSRSVSAGGLTQLGSLGITDTINYNHPQRLTWGMDSAFGNWPFSCVSSDGLAVAGTADPGTSFLMLVRGDAWEWSSLAGMSYLSPAPYATSGSYSVVTGIAKTSKRIIGMVTTSHTHACYWDAGILTYLSPPVEVGVGQTYDMHATAISDDGSKILGQIQLQSGARHPFIWSGGVTTIVSGGSESANLLSGDGSTRTGRPGSRLDLEINGVSVGHYSSYTQLEPMGLSYSGSTVIGVSGTTDSTAPTHAWAWSVAFGFIGLPSLGGQYTFATAISNDGSRISGTAADINEDYHACYWDLVGNVATIHQIPTW